MKCHCINGLADFGNGDIRDCPSCNGTGEIDMTAKNWGKFSLQQHVEFDIENNAVLTREHLFTPDEFRAFCAQLCKEQRELCAKGIPSAWHAKLARDAPMPEIE